MLKCTCTQQSTTTNERKNTSMINLIWVHVNVKVQFNHFTCIFLSMLHQHTHTQTLSSSDNADVLINWRIYAVNAYKIIRDFLFQRRDKLLFSLSADFCFIEKKPICSTTKNVRFFLVALHRRTSTWILLYLVFCVQNYYLSNTCKKSGQNKNLNG